jgi:hypothetical protein
MKVREKKALNSGLTTPTCMTTWIRGQGSFIEQIHLVDCYIYMSEVYAQTPTHYPTGRNPVEFTTVNILVYIVFPVLLVAIWILIRRNQKKNGTGENSA